MVKENLSKEIHQWMKEQVEKRDANGALVGLSGGIDSSVVGALTKEAFGENSLGVMLPAGGTITKDVEYAQKLADRFDLETIKVNMEEANNALENTFQNIDIDGVKRKYWPQTKIPTPDPAEQNIQTRLRMMTLYYIAEKMNYVVMGTSNKSEIIAGYYTLYGDGGTDMRPIGDLNKTEVWELAKQLGVPKEIIERPPTGGCRGDESDRDEKEFGITYDKLDKIYEAMESNDDLNQFDSEDIERVKKLVETAADKEKIPMFTR